MPIIMPIGDHGQLMYDYLQPYRPISYQRLDDGSEEHFQAMTEFHTKQGLHHLKDYPLPTLCSRLRIQ